MTLPSNRQNWPMLSGLTSHQIYQISIVIRVCRRIQWVHHTLFDVYWCDAVVFANQKSTRWLSTSLSNDWYIQCHSRCHLLQWTSAVCAINHDANGWRLPEAEWEIAGTNSTHTEEQGWYQNNSKGYPHQVAQFDANGWGLYDMRGNVFEWIWERFGDYELTSVTDPFHFEVPLVEVYTRPIKGGSFLSSKDTLAPYNRPNASPSLRHPAIGFRLVRTHQPKSY